jgi:hypothetical protein
MKKRVWDGYIGTRRIKGIECLDSGNRPVWIKFEPVVRLRPMEVANMLVQPEKVNWEYRNSHFETIYGNIKSNYYEANSGGSLRLEAGTTNILKDANSKILVFPLDNGGSLSVLNYKETDRRFVIVTNKPMWVAYIVSGSGSISPI